MENRPKTKMNVGYRILVFFLILFVVSIAVLTAVSFRKTEEVQTDIRSLLTPDESKWLKEHPEIILGIDPDFLPMEGVDKQGVYVGFGAEYIKHVEKKTGLKIKIVKDLGWSKVVEETKAGNIDFLACLAQTEERSKYLNFTDSYISIPAVILTRNNFENLTSIESLKGKNFVLVKDYWIADRLKKDYPELTPQVLPSGRECLEKVSIGQHDAYVGDLATSSNLIEQLGLTNLKISGHTPYTLDLRMGVRKDWPQLVSILNKVLNSISKEEKDRIYFSWVKLEQKNMWETKEFWLTVLSITFVVFATFIMFYAWNKALKKEVDIKTIELKTAYDSLEQKVEERTAQLAEAKERAEYANKAKSTFLANVSHELRTPLNAILGYSQLMLRESDMNPRQLNDLQTINKNGSHLLKLINEVLEMSKIEAGRIVLVPSSFNFNRLIEDIQAMFKYKTLEKNIEFNILVEKEVPMYIIGDENKIRQMMINLIGNAVKFTEKGSVSLTISSEKVNDYDVLKFKVEDTGVGIDEEDQKELFKPFVQSESGMRYGGTGLGLAISKEFAKLMGGDIKFGSKVGVGSWFEVTIHVHESSEKLEENIQRKVVGIKPGTTPYKFIVVDDVLENRAVLTRYLQILGMEVVEASSGENTIEIISNWVPDVVMIDLRMPGMDGYETMAAIREMGCDKVKFVVVTASAFEIDRSKAMDEYGAIGFLSKPIEENELFKMLEEKLDIEYVYEDSDEQDSKMAELTFVAEEGGYILSKVQAQKLLNAVSIADYNVMVAIATEVKAESEESGQALLQMIESFDYEGIQKWITRRELQE